MALTKATKEVISNIDPSQINQAGATNGQVLTYSTNSNSWVSTNIYSNRNRIINGDMRIDQRNNGSVWNSGVNVDSYGIDRWIAFAFGASFTAQRTTGMLGFPYAVNLNGAAGNTSAAIVQRIESANCYDLAGQTVTISFVAKSPTITSINVYLDYANSIDVFNPSVTSISVTPITISSTATTYKLTVTLPTNVTNGFQVGFGRPNHTSGTITITGVQLEKGSIATPFEFRPIGTELALCQRYCQVYSFTSGTDRIGLGFSDTTTNACTWFPFKVTPRVKPIGISVTGISNIRINGASGDTTPSAIALAESSTEGVEISYTCTGLTAFSPVRAYAIGSAKIEILGFEL